MGGWDELYPILILGIFLTLQSSLASLYRSNVVLINSKTLIRWLCLYVDFFVLSINFCCTEQYEQAVSDFKDCLTIQQECLEAEDRLLAETHYQLGLAYTFDTQYDLAIENFKSAAGVIEAKICKWRGSLVFFMHLFQE